MFLSTDTLLRTPHEVAEWRATVPATAKVGLVPGNEVRKKVLDACRSECDIVVTEGCGQGNSMAVVPVLLDAEKGDLWVEAGAEATRALRILSCTRPARVYVSLGDSKCKAYKTVLRDMWFKGLVVEVE